MSNESVLRDLFDRRERVWHESQYDLIASCVGQEYIRHDAKGDRTVTPEDDAAEIAREAVGGFVHGLPRSQESARLNHAIS